ncbi:MAG: cyclic pyranopterin monophosphate synthase MoaC [Deltaproteobacteria bacterium]|nr:cyclic pyranopterin monophosphate synthase MoaC [Deltaproteobacteria bacterium]
MDTNKLTHFDDSGRSCMVDVSAKLDTERVATATATVFMKRETFRRIIDRTIEKGDVLGVAQVAGIMAAKRTGDFIPMCHPLNITSITMDFFSKEEHSCVEVQATVKLVGKTGVEMEALVAVSTAALTIYDMCKAIDRAMTITDIQLLKKSGGKSGTFVRKGQ